MKEQNLPYEKILLEKLKKGDQTAFSSIFTHYYRDMVLFGGNFLADKKECEDVVQSIFLKLWNDRDVIQIDTYLKSYLLTAVRNGCLNEIRRKGYPALAPVVQSDNELIKSGEFIKKFRYIDDERNLNHYSKENSLNQGKGDGQNVRVWWDTNRYN